MKKPKNWLLAALVAAVTAIVTYLNTGVALP